MLSMKNKLGRKVVRFVNRHWLLFGVVAVPVWGFLLGFWTSISFRNNDWGWFVVAAICTIIWMTMMFMKAYTDKENR